MKVLISDAISDACLRTLREAEIEVDYAPDVARDELADRLPGCEGLIVRSGTKVTRDLIGANDSLRVIGRAGVGVDNIDVEAASERGIAVLNAPAGNTISTAEHTIALILALARNLPQSNRSLLEGRWERSRFKGIELRGKTLGVIGFGRVGREVARLGRGLGMRTVAHDPLVDTVDFRSEGLEPATLNDVLAQADVLTVHVPLDRSTHHTIDDARLARCRPGVRIINCARGGIIDESALLRALESGHVAGAALDVYEQEPPQGNLLLEHPNVVATPHLGAATVESQDRVAEEIAGAVVDYLVHGRSDNLVNRGALEKRSAG